jgi:predicted PurR-regulated permease PerM
VRGGVLEENRDGGFTRVQDQWIWRWGIRSWLFLGLIGAIVVMGMTYSKAHQVLLPLIVALIIGILLEPFVEFQTRHHVPRWLAVVVTMILIVAVLGGVVTLLVYGISTQARSVEQQVASGVRKIQNWLDNLKVTKSAGDFIHTAISRAWPHVSTGLINVITHSVPGIASFAIGMFIGFFFLIFLLGDDGTIKEWVAGHMGVERANAKIILDGVNTAIRGYFRGTTIIATVDAILFIPITLILGVPLVGPIVLVTFVTCYIPSFGGYLGGAFAVFIAIAAKGLGAGLIMLVYAIVVHTIMQNPIQAVAYGKTLQIHPLLALLVTLLGAVFAGIAGAILAVPITAVVLKVTREIRKAREAEEAPPGEESTGLPDPGGVDTAEEPA